MPSPSCRRVSGPTSTVPVSALDCSRAATLTTSPVAPVSRWLPPPIALITTSPVSIPTRTPKSSTPAARATVVGVLLDDPLDLQAREHRTLRVVLVRDRRAEQREDAVAGEVLHHPAEALDDLTELPDGAADHLEDVLGIEARRQLGGSRDVGEQRGDGSPSAGGHTTLFHAPSVVGRRKSGWPSIAEPTPTRKL